MKKFFTFLFLFVFLTSAALAQGPKRGSSKPATAAAAFQPADTDRPDPLALETKSVEVAGRIPVVVTGAVEASRLYTVRSFLFSGGSAYGRTDLGNNIQSMVHDAMLDVGYNSLLPRTGFQGKSRSLANAEIKLFSKSAEYAVIPEISFITAQNSQKSVDPGPVGRTIGREVGGRAGRIIREASDEFKIEWGKGMVEVLLTLRFYDRGGQEVRYFDAVEKIEWKAYEAFQIAIISGRSQNTPTFTPLARKLVDKVKAKMVAAASE